MESSVQQQWKRFWLGLRPLPHKSEIGIGIGIGIGSTIELMELKLAISTKVVDSLSCVCGV